MRQLLQLPEPQLHKQSDCHPLDNVQWVAFGIVVTDYKRPLENLK